MAKLDRLTVYPVKGLGGIDLDAARVLDGGTIEHDREYALFDENNEVFNAKRSDRFHRLQIAYDTDTGELMVQPPDGDTRQFDLRNDRETASKWFSGYFETNLSLRRDDAIGFVDRREMGPSVISTATLQTVASWFDDLTVESVRRRLRANIEISGVEPFWEDRFVGENAPQFEIDGVALEGVTPCARCAVPERDPDTGEPLPEFRQRFIKKREETFPDHADREAFDHFYTLMLIARVSEADRDSTLQVADPVTVVDE